MIFFLHFLCLLFWISICGLIPFIFLYYINFLFNIFLWCLLMLGILFFFINCSFNCWTGFFMFFYALMWRSFFFKKYVIIKNKEITKICYIVIIFTWNIFWYNMKLFLDKNIISVYFWLSCYEIFIYLQDTQFSL